MNRRVQAAIFHMTGDLRHVAPLTEVAAIVKISPSRLRRLFKSETGETPAQYLKRMRLQQAAELLVTDFYSVKEVMNKVGLQNQSHFTHDFKRAYRLTPTQYRAQFSIAHLRQTLFWTRNNRIEIRVADADNK